MLKLQFEGILIILIFHVLAAILNRGGVPGTLSVLVRASSIRLIRASGPLVVVRFSLLHRDRKSFTYSLPSLRSSGIGPRIRIPCSASRRHVFKTCVVYAFKTPCRMQVQLALRLLLHLRSFWRSLLLSRRRTRKKQTGTENFVAK